METTEVIRTVVCPLETSERKNEKLERGVSDFQRAAKKTAEMLPSFQERNWQRNNSQVYRTVQNELGETEIKDKVIQNAVHRVIENFKSARERDASLPKAGIPDCDFVILTNQGYDIAENDRGYGFKAKFIPYKTEWWHLDIGEYQEDYFERVFNGDARFGQAELALTDRGPIVRIAVTWEQEVTTREDAEYIVGVDVGYNTIYAVAVRERETGEIVDVSIRSGHDFQHIRNHVQDSLTRFKKAGKLDRASKERDIQEHYTNHILSEAACEVVDLSAEYSPCVIAIEDIEHYREKDRENAIHDWPYSKFQSEIVEKAHAEGIGIEKVEPYYTSQTCSECGFQDSENRKETHFECVSCGYQVNADVNAAMNISGSGVGGE